MSAYYLINIYLYASEMSYDVLWLISKKLKGSFYIKVFYSFIIWNFIHNFDQIYFPLPPSRSSSIPPPLTSCVLFFNPLSSLIISPLHSSMSLYDFYVVIQNMGSCFRLTFQLLKGILIFILFHLRNIDNIFFSVKNKKEKTKKTKITLSWQGGRTAHEQPALL